MARKHRIQQPNTIYHTWSYVHDHISMTGRTVYREILLQVVRKTREKYNFRLLDYSLGEDEFHLVIQTVQGGEEISRIMQYIKARFAEIYNRLNKRTGAFWLNRYRDEIIDKKLDSGEFVRYLHSVMGVRASNHSLYYSPYEGISIYITGRSIRYGPEMVIFVENGLIVKLL